MDKHTRSKKRANAFVKFAVVCILIFFIVASIKMNIDINNMKEHVLKVQAEVVAKKSENEKIKSEISSFELNEETVKKIAREKLGLRENDAIIFECTTAWCDYCFVAFW